MKNEKGKSFYKSLGKTIQGQIAKTGSLESLDLNRAIRQIREQKQLSGVALCRKAGDLDPKTLTAVEKGRIKNPSIKTLQSIARGLDVSVADLFRKSEIRNAKSLYYGTPKGAFQMELSEWGVRMVSFTPLIRQFFLGKLIFTPRKKITEICLGHPYPVFISSLMGRFEIRVEDQEFNLKEGDNLFFQGQFSHTIYNPLHKEAILLMMTAPSFL